LIPQGTEVTLIVPLLYPDLPITEISQTPLPHFRMVPNSGATDTLTPNAFAAAKTKTVLQLSKQRISTK